MALLYLIVLIPVHFLALLPQFQCTSAEHFRSRYGPPRFKQNARTHQFAYLGDTIRFKCNAIGRPQPKVHWYRDGQYLNYSYLNAHPRLKERGMSLEVRRIEVDDRGNWTCRVWNNEGSTSRNFSLHIVDFCDYFLNVHIHPRRIPEECLCQWAIQQRDSLASPDLYQLRALPQLRADLDLSEFLQNPLRCQKYAKVEEIARLRIQPREGKKADAVQQESPSARSNPKSTINPTKVQLTSPRPSAVSSSSLPIGSSTRKWRPTLKNLSAKIQLARKIVKGTTKKKEEKDESEEEGEDKGGRGEEEKKTTMTTTTMSISSSTTAMTSTTTRPWTVRRPAWLTSTRRWSLPQRVPPYFRQLEENTQTNIVIPAGRTLKLACKAGGQPEPQVVWRKGNEEILSDSESKTGSLYQLRKWSLELEDAAEVDSGEYACEVFNSAGSIVRRFRVEVQDRIRSRPILVPNVLQNQTVDVNGTVNFMCQVISDLVPHVIWIKLIHRNGSYLRWDPKEQRQTLNFLDLSKVKRVRIFHDRQTNRYTMELANVTMEDQGIYSCVVGNTLGLSMANATLTVNEFRSLTLPTEVPTSWPLSYTVLLILSFLLLCAFVALCMLYLFFSKKFSAKNRIQTLDKMAVRKKVVITKKPQREGEHWSDLASSYSITVEPVPVMGGGGGGGREGRQRTGTGDTIPLMGSRGEGHQNADSSLLSDYEVPTDMAWEIERDRLQLVDILGEGAFGEVWRAQLVTKSAEESAVEMMPVAVKRLKAAAQERELIILVSEMQILKSIGHHPNILRLIGCCTGLGPLLVVLELCNYGNLRDFLRKHRPRELTSEEEGMEGDSEGGTEEEEGEGEGTSSRGRRRQKVVMYQNVDRAIGDGGEEGGAGIGRPLTLRDLVQFATEIARGMEFLASKKIIHRDLAARNVLVTRDLSMKISDFGLSRNVFYHDYYRKRGAGRLPIKWMAPEALEANVYTVHSDVWSYGILLWEIMTLGGTPYPSIAMPQLYNLLKEGYRMEAPHNCPEEIYEVMASCWQEKADTRPAFRTIGDYFDWMLAEADKADTSQRSDTENGETTDEGPYAVIPEGSQGKETADGEGTAGERGPSPDGRKQEAEERGQQGRRREEMMAQQQQRPMSAPVGMTFEIFAREMAIAESDGSGGGSQHTPEYIRLPATKPERRSLLEQLKKVVWNGDRNGGGSENDNDNNNIVANGEGGKGSSSFSKGRPIYNNLQPSPPASSSFYANTAASSTDQRHQPGPPSSSSSTESFLPPTSSSAQQPPKRPKKKSIVSEHGLRVQGVIFAGIAQQNAKLGGLVNNIGGSAGSSASFGRSPPGSSSIQCGGKLAPADWRSMSMDSSTSSGHGGSSAMSSADALLAMTEPVKEEAGEESPPMGQTVDYVSIAPIGQFPTT